MNLILTTTRRPSHNVVLKDWNFAGGLPGRTARIEAVMVESRRCVRRGEVYTIARSKRLTSSNITERSSKRKGGGRGKKASSLEI